MSQPERTKTLLVEFDLPDFYAEDLPDSLIQWMREFGKNPDDPAELGEEILRDSVRIGCSYLITEVEGEKDSDFVAIKVIPRSARVENRVPSDPSDLRSWGRLSARIARAARRIQEPRK